MQFISTVIGGTFGLIFSIAWFLLVLYALLGILKNANLNMLSKLIWIIIIVVVPILGSLLYIIWGRNQSFL